MLPDKSRFSFLCGAKSRAACLKDDDSIFPGMGAMSSVLEIWLRASGAVEGHQSFFSFFFSFISLRSVLTLDGGWQFQ